MATLNLSNFFKSTPGAGFGLQFLRKLLVAFLEILTIVDYQVIQTVWGAFWLFTTTACEALHRNAPKLADSGCALLRHDWALDSLHHPINFSVIGGETCIQHRTVVSQIMVAISLRLAEQSQ